MFILDLSLFTNRFNLKHQTAQSCACLQVLWWSVLLGGEFPNYFRLLGGVHFAPRWRTPGIWIKIWGEKGYCEAVSEWEEKQMGEKQLEISFSVGFSDTSFFVHSSPTCLLDFEWRIPADTQEQDKIFLFITRKTEQLWWVQRALKHPNLRPTKATPMDTQKQNCSSYSWEIQSVNPQMQTWDAFSFSALLPLP